MVFGDFFPPGDGIAGLDYFPTVFLAVDTFPFYGVPSFFPFDLDGVYLRIFSTLLPTSAAAASFFAFFAFDLDAAFFFPFAPPFTFGAAATAGAPSPVSTCFL